MNWFGDHWLQRVAAALGGGLIWAFAPSVVPNNYQPVLFAIGALLIAGALFWPFIRRHILWRFAIRPPNGLPASVPVKEEAEPEGGEALPKRLLEALIDPGDLHVGEAGVSAGKLNEEHWLEFYFRFFNASDKDLAVAGVYGIIQCGIVVNNSIPEDLKFDLPTPSILWDRSDLKNIAPRAETIIVLQQFLVPAMVERLQRALDEQNGVQFYFDDLGIMITGAKDRTAAAVLPIPMGTYLRKEGGVLRTGRVTRLKVQAAISGVT